MVVYGTESGDEATIIGVCLPQPENKEWQLEYAKQSLNVNAIKYAQYSQHLQQPRPIAYAAASA